MPSNSSGWFWHTLAVLTGRIGHLYSPGAQRGPWPWFPFALDCRTFPLWDPATNSFNEEEWRASGVIAWRQLLFWAQAVDQPALWSIVPDRPGDKLETLRKWDVYAPEVLAAGIPLAIAVQDGMTSADVRLLSPAPQVVCVGGSTAWKWGTVEMWTCEFPRVHLLRCNSPEKLEYLHKLGVESCDGTGWNRGDRTQTAGLEDWAKQHADRIPKHHSLWPHVSRATCKRQTTFA